MKTWLGLFCLSSFTIALITAGSVIASNNSLFWLLAVAFWSIVFTTGVWALFF